jgi:hypothetical protein
MVDTAKDCELVSCGDCELPVLKQLGNGPLPLFKQQALLHSRIKDGALQ